MNRNEVSAVVLETPYTPPVTRATVRRSAIIAAAVAAIAFAVCVPLGYGLYALFGVVGLALGLFNSYLVMVAVTNFAATKPSRGRFTGSVLGRLALVTIIAFAIALIFRPAGVAVFAGIAVFQFVAVMSSMVPLIKEIKKR